MAKSIFIAAESMKAQQACVDVRAQNMAQLGMHGAKPFEPLLASNPYQEIVPPGTMSSDSNQLPTGLHIGSGVRLAATTRIITQGQLTSSSRDLDLAISGNGYFQVKVGDKTAYTRDGTFGLSKDGKIVTTIGGYVLQPEITIPDNAQSIQINESGEVFVKVDGNIQLQSLGKISVTNFINPAGLSPAPNNVFYETDASGQPKTGEANTEAYGSILQGTYEESTSEMIKELTDLIKHQKAYELNSKVLMASSEMLSMIPAVMR